MRAGIAIEVTSADRIRLEATAEACGALEIVFRSGLSKSVVRR